MDIRKVKKLIELLEESDIGEIEIKEGEESVRISRYGNQPAMPVAYAAPAPVAPASAPTPAAAEAPAAEAAAPAAAAQEALPRTDQHWRRERGLPGGPAHRRQAQVARHAGPPQQPDHRRRLRRTR